MGVKLEGALGDDGYVMDFGEVKGVVVAICKEWNERFICPMNSDALEIKTVEGNLTIDCEDGAHFSFPADDCLLLPIVHSSAEEIAEYFCSLLVKRLSLNYLVNRKVTKLEISVAEACNQEALYTVDLSLDLDPDSMTFVRRNVVPKPCIHTIL